MELTCQVLPKYSTMTSRKAATETCAKNRIDTANVKQRNLGKQTTHDHAMRIFKSKKTKPIECSRGSGEGTSKGTEDWSKLISGKREPPTGTKNKETCRNFVKTNTKSPEKLSEVRERKSEEKNTFKSTLQKELYEKKSEGREKKSVEKSANIAEKNIESSKKQSSDKSSASSISKKTEVTSLKKPEVTPKKAELKSVYSKMDVSINPKKTEVTSAQTKKSVVTLSAQKKSEMTSKKPDMTIKQQETKIPSLAAIRKRKFVYTDDEEDEDDDEDRFVFEKRQKKKVDSKEEMRNLSHATVLINEILSEQSKCSSALPPPPSTGHPTGHPADSALSPGQSSTVSESPTDDGVDSLSANLAKNQRSGTGSVSMTSSSATERNVFEKFSSIMGSANESVVSSSTSSQVSEEDDDAVGSDVTGSKTSVETQTSDITPPPPAIPEMKAASSGKIHKSTASSGGSIAEGRGDKGQVKKTSSVSLASVGNTGQFQKPTSGGVDPGVMSSTPRSANASAVGMQSPSRLASSSAAASSSVPAAGSTHRSPILTTDIKPTRDLQRNTASVQLIPLSSPAAASAASVATSSADASATAAAADVRGSSLKKTSLISPKQKTIAIASNNIPSLGPEIARSSNKACKDTSPARSAPANASATLVKTTSTGGARPTSAVGVGSASGLSLGTTGGSVQRLQEAKRDNYIRRPTVVDDPSRIARNAVAAASAAGRTSGPAAAPGKRSEACISLSRTAVAGAICSPISLPSAAIPSERADSSIVGHVRTEVATTEARRREAGSFWNSSKEIAPTKNIETDKLSPEHNNNPKISRNRESDDLPLRHMAAGTVVKSGSVTGRNDKATTSKADDKSASSNPPSKARLFKPYQMDSRPKSPAPKSAFPTSGLSNPFPPHSELSSQFRTSGGISFPYASTSSSRNPKVETRVKVNSQEAINLSHSPSESTEREETNNNVRLKSAVHCGFPCLIKVPNFKPSDRNVSSARSTERTSSSHRKEMKGGLEEKTSPVASTAHTTASIPHPSSIPSSIPSSSFPSASASSFTSSSPAIHRLPVLKISPYRRSSLDQAPQASSSSLQVQDQTRDPQPTKSDRVRNLMQYSISTVSKSPSPVRAHTSATCASPGNISCKDADKTDIPSKPSSSLSLENQTHTKATSRAHEGSVSSVGGRGEQTSLVLARGVDCTKTASEVFYTCAEADSGSSPSKRATGSRSSSTSSMGSRTDSSSRLDESSNFGLTKKLVIDLDRLSPPPPFQTSPEKSPSSRIPADKAASPLRDSPTPPGKKRLVFSIRKTEEQYRCTRSRSFPETNNSSTSPTFSSSTSPTYSSSTTAESVDAAEGLLPPNAKRIKFLGKDFTFTRTLDNSKCSRPPRRRRSTATCGGSQQASPTSVHLHPVVVNEPELLPCREPVEEISNPALPPPTILQVDEDLPATPSSIYEVDSTSGGVVSSLPCVEGTSSEVPEAADWNINSQLSIPYQPDTEMDAPLELTKKVKSSVDNVPLELMNKDVPLELTTKEVKDRQKQLEYQKRMSTYPPTSKMFASCVLPAS